MVAMDDKALALLRQKLQALNYTGEGGPAAMRSRARRGRAFLGLGIPVASGGGGGGGVFAVGDNMQGPWLVARGGIPPTVAVGSPLHRGADG